MSSTTEERKSTKVIADPLHPPISGREAENAVNDLLVYPKILRGNTDRPVGQQNYGLLSFLLLKEPKKTESGKPCYGFIKLRGNYADKNLCANEASRIIREQDSANKIRIIEVGSWVPITDDDGTSEKIDVRTDTPAEEEKMKREAMKQREEESARIMREIKERTEEVKNAPDLNDDKESLDYYVMSYVTWMRLQENMEQFRAKTKDLENKWKKVRRTLVDLDEKHPEYNTVWLDRYNEERRKTKIPDFIPGPEQDELYKQKIVD